MIRSAEKLLRGRRMIAYGAGEYYDRAMKHTTVTPEYFVDDERLGGEKCGRAIKPVSALREENGDAVVFIFERNIPQAILRLSEYGCVWKQNLFDCRCFGVNTLYYDDYVHVRDLDELGRSAVCEISIGFGAEITIENVVIPVRQNGGMVRMRFGNRSRTVIRDCVIGQGCELNAGGNAELVLGVGTTVGEECMISAATDSWVRLDGRILLSHHSIVDAANGVGIQVGDACTFGWHLHLYAYAPLKIGGDCMCSSNVYIESGAGHDLIVDGKKRYPEPMEIGGHVWLGMGCCVLGGAGIGEDSMVGAHTVVTKKFGAAQLLAGNPARVVKEKIVWDRNYTAYKELYH
jgi:acetyltransferase-like isoleucine patch superfamily enzyme